jgi:hypothetical protein
MNTSMDVFIEHGYRFAVGMGGSTLQYCFFQVQDTRPAFQQEQ